MNGPAAGMRAQSTAVARVEREAKAGESPAVRYWRTACSLAAAHLFGATWPPPGVPQRSRVVGHWGCNPGIAWIVGHLAAAWSGAKPLLLVVGTGHAASFLFAHDAISRRLDHTEISAATARYGMPGGAPSELIDLPGLLYSGGELGPALAVSQGLAAHGTAPAVACVIGDGECETPAALAAFAHAEVLLGGRGGAWLPVVNANGGRMGGRARFGPAQLERMLAGLGYDVVTSGDSAAEAGAAAAAALSGCLSGRRIVWVSVTEKGWPAPRHVDGKPYRGHLAHKAPTQVRRHGMTADALRDWFDALRPHQALTPDGMPAPDVVELARRVSPWAIAASTTASPEPASAAVTGSSVHRGWTDRVAWRPPVDAVDEVLAALGIVVYCPDEASSNGLARCLSRGLVTEVLAEEVCAGWTWGTVEAGRPAVFATYEAFAPLAASMIAQYAKLTHSRPPRSVPPLMVLATSLSWANAPTHQNTDLTGSLLARPLPRISVLYPVGASSAALRVERCAEVLRDGVGLVICSKQDLLDLPDPGTSVIRYRLGGPPSAVIMSVGDVCATEALGAAALAAAAGIGIDVLAIVDIKAAVASLRALAVELSGLPLVATTACAPAYVAASLWEPLGRTFPVHGYRERWGATAWETLRANRMDRVSLLESLADAGVPVPPELIEEAAERLDRWHAGAVGLAGVPPFDCPSLHVNPDRHVETA